MHRRGQVIMRTVHILHVLSEDTREHLCYTLFQEEAKGHRILGGGVQEDFKAIKSIAFKNVFFNPFSYLAAYHKCRDRSS